MCGFIYKTAKAYFDKAYEGERQRASTSLLGATKEITM
jgi:hypothetical protein